MIKKREVKKQIDKKKPDFFAENKDTDYKIIGEAILEDINKNADQKQKDIDDQIDLDDEISLIEKEDILVEKPFENLKEDQEIEDEENFETF